MVNRNRNKTTRNILNKKVFDAYMENCSTCVSISRKIRGMLSVIRGAVKNVSTKEKE